MSQQKKLSATGDVTTRDAYLKSVIFEAAAAQTLDLREGGAGGTVLASFRLAAGGTVVWTSGDKRGAAYAGGIHATLSGGTAAIEFE